VKVASNTSPLTNLAAIGHFELLRLLYGELHIAEAVWEELNAFNTPWPGRDGVAAAPWVRRHTVGNHALVRALQRDLDAGEAQTIALALEQAADLTLLDERDGRHSAQRLGLRTAGVLAVLLEAKHRRHISAIRPLLDSLRNTAGFYLSERLYADVLSRARETDANA
jgi:predicted nucleic acid-binding protein